MSTKHTPSPWTFNAERLTVDAGGIPVADVRCSEIADEAVEPNGYLIAAAPDLLEACKRMVDFEQRLLCSNDGGPALAADIRAAIAKAEGSK